MDGYVIMAIISNNINNYVYVQLTQYGRDIHKNAHHDLMAALKEPPKNYVYNPPKEDEDGWSKWQLWNLMNYFGKAMYMGNDTPFKTTIKMEVDGDSVVQLWDLKLFGYNLINGETESNNCPFNSLLNYTEKSPTRDELLAIRDKYYELVYAVGNKCHGETRHDTALKYILQAENVVSNAVANGK